MKPGHYDTYVRCVISTYAVSLDLQLAVTRNEMSDE